MSKSDKGSAVNDAVYNYMYEQDRPYSVNDLVQNLHKEHGKAAVQKALDWLVQADKVKEKTYGKQKVYVVNQSLFPDINDEELGKLDHEIAELNTQVVEKEKKCKAAEAELKAMDSSLTDKEIAEQYATVTQEVERLGEKLRLLSENQAPLVSAEEQQRVKRSREESIVSWKKRRRMCLDLADAIMEGYPKSRSDLFEETGVETDQDVGATMP